MASAEQVSMFFSFLLDLHVIDGDLPDSIENVIPGKVFMVNPTQRTSDCWNCWGSGEECYNHKDRRANWCPMAWRLLWRMQLLQGKERKLMWSCNVLFLNMFNVDILDIRRTVDLQTTALQMLPSASPFLRITLPCKLLHCFVLDWSAIVLYEKQVPPRLWDCTVLVPRLI